MAAGFKPLSMSLLLDSLATLPISTRVLIGRVARLFSTPRTQTLQSCCKNLTVVKFEHSLNCLMNHPGNGGYVDAYKEPASTKFPHPNLLYVIVENHSHHTQAIKDCPFHDCPDSGGFVDAYEEPASKNAHALISSSSLLRTVAIIPEQSKNAPSLIALTVGDILMCKRDLHPQNSHPQSPPAHCWES